MFKNITRNPKTSILGLSPVLLAVVNGYIPPEYQPVARTATELLLGLGLLLAKDADK